MSGRPSPPSGADTWSTTSPSARAEVTAYPSSTAISTSAPSRSAYAVRKPWPESPTGRTRTSAPAQPDASAAPAWADVKAPMPSDATNTRMLTSLQLDQS